MKEYGKQLRAIASQYQTQRHEKDGQITPHPGPLDIHHPNSNNFDGHCKDNGSP